MDGTMDLKLHANGGGTVTAESPAVALCAAHAKTEPYPRTHNYWLLLLFFVSGAAALIYQICWQRLLFESVGVDIESVTIIVSTFMLGREGSTRAYREIGISDSHHPITHQLPAQFRL